MSKELWKPGNMLYPLPAVMVSCRGKDGKDNIITVAWTGTVCTNPPMVYISLRPNRHSYSMIKDTGEFVINLAAKKLAEAVDYCGVRSGKEADKFQEMHLTKGKAAYVSAPVIQESPVNIECRVTEVKPLGSHHMFLAEVLGVHVEKSLLDSSGRLCLRKAELLAYSHGGYFLLGELLGSFGYSVKKKVPKKKRKGGK